MIRLGRAAERLSRRRLLRGAGTIAIGLPLAVWSPDFAGALPGGAPSRYVSLFFGNGLPKKLSASGFTGALAPLAPLASKITMARGLVLNESGGSSSIHYRGSGRFGVGARPPTDTTAAGPTLDHVLHADRGEGTRLLTVNLHAHVTGGHPATRWYRSWRGVNLPNDELLRPLDVFDRVFGPLIPPEAPLTAEERRAIRYRNSVLDTVIEQYREVKSERAGYDARTRALLADHLDLVRSLERRSADVGAPMTGDPACDIPDPPPDLEPSQACTPELCRTDDAFYHGSAGSNWNEVWALNSDLYAAALRCGAVRFGTMGLTGGGDTYPIPELVPLGVTESAHTLAHDWRADRENGFDLCVRWIMDKVAYFLRQLDDPAWPDRDGGTVLDDTVVLIGTENGAIDSGQHWADWMTFFVAGGGARFRTGDHVCEGRSDVDLYSTVARVMELGETFGEPRHFSGHLDIVR